MVYLPLVKPLFGQPCNGCGECCRAQLCEVGEKQFPGASAPCPALEWEDGRTWCGMIRHPSRHMGLNFNGDEMLIPMFRQLLPIGQGCGMED